MKKICHLEKTFTNFYEHAKNFIIKTQQLRINYIEEITIKSDAKKEKECQISKKIPSLQPIIRPWSHNFYGYQQNYDVIVSKYVA